MIKGVIFDMDGLMVDSEVMAFRALKKSLEEHKLDYPKDFHIKLTGRNNEDSIRIFAEEFSDFEKANSIQNRVLELMDIDFLENGVPAKKGLFDIFDYLIKNNIKIAVASSNTRKMIDSNLKSLGLFDVVEYISAGDEVEKSKPHPEIFLKALNNLGLEKKNAIVLEDSIFGVEGAFRAGINVIIIPDTIPHNKDSIEKSIAVLKDLNQVITYIEKNNEKAVLKEKL